MPGVEKKPWSKEAKATGPWDTIVIGSGMGGMTAAAILAKLGQRVLVLEQHYTPGGFTHVFKRGPYEWDVGVHAIGEVTPKALMGRLLHHLTDGRLKWTSLGGVYDEFYYPDLRIDFPDSASQFRRNLLEAFPEEEDSIDAYLDRVRLVGRGMKNFLKSRALPPNWLGRQMGRLLGASSDGEFKKRLQDVLDEIVPNKKLQKVLTGQWAYHGSPPSRAAFGIQALVTRHFLHGAFYPEGGSAQIALQLLRTVAEAEGWTRVRADVQEILVEKERAVGVKLASGEVLKAHRIVSAAGIMSTAKRLLAPQHRGPWCEEVEALSPAPAHLCLYLGFKGDIRSAGAGSANKWFYNTWDVDMGEWQVEPRKPIPDCPVLYCSFPSLKNPNHDPGPEQRHTAEVVTFVPWDIFKPWRDQPWRNRDQDYQDFKAALTQKLLEQFFAKMPGLEPLLDLAELGTPLSTEHFCRPVRGSIYGIEPTPERYQCEHLRAHSPIKNLFFAGCEVGSVGVMGAMSGGMICAMAMEPRRVGKLMATLG